MKHGYLLFFLTALLAMVAGASARAIPVAGTASPSSSECVADECVDGNDEPYTLSAAYPNPFHSRTRFDLHVKKRQRISVEVYNLLGQRVRTLYQGTLGSGSAHTFTFKAGNLPSGLYLYRIEGENFTAARRVTLVR